MKRFGFSLLLTVLLMSVLVWSVNAQTPTPTPTAQETPLTEDQEDIVEEIRTSLMGSLRLHYSSTIIRNITTVMQEKVLDERKPYSDKEKLDYLSKKFPDLKGAIETLHLRLP